MESKRLQWAKEELERYIKNVDGDWQDAVECAKIALTAIKGLDKKTLQLYDSMWFLVELLDRLQKGRPLTPIEDKDFLGQDGMIHEDPRYLKEMELKSNLQCKRMPGLFRRETKDGKITYHDVNRTICYDEEEYEERIAFSSGEADRLVDRMFPIQMPYWPGRRKYVVMFRDGKPIWVKTPEGERIDL